MYKYSFKGIAVYRSGRVALVGLVRLYYNRCRQQGYVDYAVYYRLIQAVHAKLVCNSLRYSPNNPGIALVRPRVSWCRR